MDLIDWVKNRIYNVDCRTGLKQLPENSIYCMITSPPYWALRDYGIDPAIWDEDPTCEHDWKEERKNVEGIANTGKRWQHGSNRKEDPESWSKEILLYAFCRKCGAFKGHLGLEPSMELYIKHLCDIFDLCKRPLKKNGSLWVNLGDSYSSSIKGQKGKDSKEIFQSFKLKVNTNLPDKCLCLIPFRFAIEMTNRGWILRNVIIWKKRNPVPSSAKDRFTVNFEYLFFFVQNKKYYHEQQLEPYQTPESHRHRPTPYIGKHTEGVGGQGIHDGIRTREAMFKIGARVKRTVWTINTVPSKEKHFAVFPGELVETPILASCPQFVCTKCGKPREIKYDVVGTRITDRMKVSGCDEDGGYTGQDIKEYEGTGACSPSDLKRRILKAMGEVREHYYTDCECGVDFKPSIVLDMFSGLGTALRKALELGRDYIGFDLSDEYCEIAERLMEQKIEFEIEKKGENLGDVGLI